MTREEAIERFENVKANALVQKASGVSEYWQNEIDGTIKAIDMAIEALQAEYEDYEHATLVDIKEPLKVSVVRRKDCVHGQKATPIENGNDILCDYSDWEYSDNDFCSRGERKDK